MDGGFGVDVDVPRSEDGPAQGAACLVGLGDVVFNIGAVVEVFLCDRPDVETRYNQAGRRLYLEPGGEPPEASAATGLIWQWCRYHRRC